MTSPTPFAATTSVDDRFAVLVASARTGGALAVTVATVTGRQGRCVHHQRDGVLVVLEGGCTVTAGDLVVDAGPGQVVFVPRGSACQVDVRTPTARLLTVLAPGGAEDLLAALHAGPAPPPDVLVRLAADCGAQLLIDPVPPTVPPTARPTPGGSS